jgi:hypothetical protein
MFGVAMQGKKKIVSRVCANKSAVTGRLGPQCYHPKVSRSYNQVLRKSSCEITGSSTGAIGFAIYHRKIITDADIRAKNQLRQRNVLAQKSQETSLRRVRSPQVYYMGYLLMRDSKK